MEKGSIRIPVISPAGLAVITRFCGKKSYPVLSNVHVNAENGVFSIEATDGVNALILTYGTAGVEDDAVVDLAEKFDVLLKPDAFKKIFKSMGLRYGHARVSINDVLANGQDASEYPDLIARIPAVGENVALKVDSNYNKGAIMAYEPISFNLRCALNAGAAFGALMNEPAEFKAGRDIFVASKINGVNLIILMAKVEFK